MYVGKIYVPVKTVMIVNVYHVHNVLVYIQLVTKYVNVCSLGKIVTTTSTRFQSGGTGYINCAITSTFNSTVQALLGRYTMDGQIIGHQITTNSSMHNVQGSFAGKKTSIIYFDKQIMKSVLRPKRCQTMSICDRVCLRHLTHHTLTTFQYHTN